MLKPEPVSAHLFTGTGLLTEELDDFIHMMAHNLKNPLGVVISYADFLQKYGVQATEAQLQADFQVIWQNGHQMNNIIDQLVLLMSLRTERPDPRPVNMAEIVGSAQRRLAYLIDEHQAQISAPTTWPAVSGHSIWLEEIWLNLCSNAIKYGGHPPQVTLGATLSDNGWVRFWVRDNGPGLSLEAQQQLFQPFTALNQVRLKGDGLGLPVVRYLAEKLGGQVGVESNGAPDTGCVFSFYLRQAS